MQRRDFLKNAALVAGVAAVAPSELMHAADSSAAGASSDTGAGAAGAGAGASGASGAGAGDGGAAGASSDAGASKGESSYKAPRKSIMWGTVGYPGSVLEKCKAVKAAGFDGIEPNSHMDRAEVLDAMAATGLVASSVCNCMHWKELLSSPDAAVRSRGITAQIRAMEDAKAYGTDAVLLVPGRVDANTSYKDCWERSTECIKELVPVAKQLGVHICIENVWNNFLTSPFDMQRFVDQFHSKWVGSYFDCGNILKFGWPEQWIDILGSRVKRVHIKEFSNSIENKSGRGAGFDVALTEGEVNWAACMAALKPVYSGGWLTTEQGANKSVEELTDLCRRLSKIVAL